MATITHPFSRESGKGPNKPTPRCVQTVVEVGKAAVASEVGRFRLWHGATHILVNVCIHMWPKVLPSTSVARFLNGVSTLSWDEREWSNDSEHPPKGRSIAQDKMLCLLVRRKSRIIQMVHESQDVSSIRVKTFNCFFLENELTSKGDGTSTSSCDNNVSPETWRAQRDRASASECSLPDFSRPASPHLYPIMKPLVKYIYRSSACWIRKNKDSRG